MSQSGEPNLRLSAYQLSTFRERESIDKGSGGKTTSEIREQDFLEGCWTRDEGSWLRGHKWCPYDYEYDPLVHTSSPWTEGKKKRNLKKIDHSEVTLNT